MNYLSFLLRQLAIIRKSWAKKLSRKGFFKSWTTRLFVLTAKQIDYYADAEMQVRKGIFFLDSSTVTLVENERKNQFTIKSNLSGSMLIETTTPDQMREWLTAIETTVRNHHSFHPEIP